MNTPYKLFTIDYEAINISVVIIPRECEKRIHIKSLADFCNIIIIDDKPSLIISNYLSGFCSCFIN